MKITQDKMAKIAKVTTRTIINWEKEKPELIKIIKAGIEADNIFLDFFKQFEPYELFELHTFYIDFYFKFLNHFRKNITKYNENNTDINSTAVLYLIEKHKSELIDQTLLGDEIQDMNNFKRKSFRDPLFNVNEKLSTYILKNTLDGFETLVEDALTKDETLFENSLLVSINYLVYMFYPLENHKEKEKIKKTIFEKKLNCNIYSTINPDENREKDKKVIYQNYLKFKKELFIEEHDVIFDEWVRYCNNDFYVPTFIKEIENDKQYI